MMLLLLVISVAMMGVLIFGKPTLWYLEGKKERSRIPSFIYRRILVYRPDPALRDSLHRVFLTRTAKRSILKQAIKAGRS